MFSTLSILDGEATISCPQFVAVGAAVDALVHIIEGYSCKNSNEFSDKLAEIGFKYILDSIMDLKNKRADINKRLNLLKGTHLAGIVVMNSGSGVASAVSYPLSVYYGVPHGIGGGMFLLYVAKYNCSKKFDKYKYLNRYLNFKKNSTSLSVINHLQKIFDKLGVPKKLHRFGIHEDDYNKLNKIMKTQQAAFDQNPIKFTVKKDFKKMIKNFL
jgi:alcohol dehydrogenase